MIQICCYVWLSLVSVTRRSHLDAITSFFKDSLSKIARLSKVATVKTNNTNSHKADQTELRFSLDFA